MTLNCSSTMTQPTINLNLPLNLLGRARKHYQLKIPVLFHIRLAYHENLNGHTNEWQWRIKIKPISPLMLIWFPLHAFSVILQLLQSSIYFQVKQDMNCKCKRYIRTKNPKQQTTTLKKDYLGGTGLGWTTFSTNCLY